MNKFLFPANSKEYKGTSSFVRLAQGLVPWLSWIEQQPSKLWVLGSNPNGITKPKVPWMSVRGTFYIVTEWWL